eukprot:CAMPEP_0170493624 /NCGR_PEP_ID=MMETSP0208-20121228/14181_1 /TAXON_ID=197538 /ORGANISM="Strombidium inclinatum, Strain S3" /LENGTH=180 /DNA_ID=CAMNT_0010769575 /DNA_START=338 /DNA_END=876 /DNA_ORIENTATION=+
MLDGEPGPVACEEASQEENQRDPREQEQVEDVNLIIEEAPQGEKIVPLENTNGSFLPVHAELSEPVPVHGGPEVFELGLPQEGEHVPEVEEPVRDENQGGQRSHRPEVGASPLQKLVLPTFDDRWRIEHVRPHISILVVVLERGAGLLEGLRVGISVLFVVNDLSCLHLAEQEQQAKWCS